jgi:hypothetical protein
MFICTKIIPLKMPIEWKIVGSKIINYHPVRSKLLGFPLKKLSGNLILESEMGLLNPLLQYLNPLHLMLVQLM